jgi:hypothetical protein
VACVIVNGGKQQVSNALVTPQKYGQWGTGAGTAAVADTGLFSTSTTTEARVAATQTQITGAQTNSKIQYVFTITAAGSRTILEVALWDAAGSGSPPTGGNFFIHADHGSTALNSGDSIAYTLTEDFTP